MIGEINIAGIFVSPLLLCMAIAFPLRLLLSKLLEVCGGYRLVAQRPMFDTALFLVLTGVIFALLRHLTTP